MLSSCANPSCSGQFRYLHQGKLFVFRCHKDETITTARLDFAGHVDHLHYAWLCDSCLQSFELVLDLQDRIKVRYRDHVPGLSPDSVMIQEPTLMEKVDRVLRRGNC